MVKLASIWAQRTLISSSLKSRMDRFKGKISKRLQRFLMQDHTFLKCNRCGHDHGVTLRKATFGYVCSDCDKRSVKSLAAQSRKERREAARG